MTYRKSLIILTLFAITLISVPYYGLIVNSHADGPADIKKLVEEKINECVKQKKCRLDKETDLRKERYRIIDWLECIARDPLPSEKTMYTWGFINKIIDMKSLSRQNYYAKDYARQRKSEEVAYRKSMYLRKNKTLDAKTKIDMESAKTFDNSKYYDMHDLRDLLDEIKERETVQILAFERIYPGFLDNLNSDPLKELKDLTARFKSSCKKDALSETCKILEGEILGLNIMSGKTGFNTGQFTFQSEMSGGYGVYMSHNPSYAVKHFSGGGIAVNTGSVKIIDVAIKNQKISYNDQGVRSVLDELNNVGLVNAKILETAEIKLTNEDMPTFMSPNHQHNQWVSPDLFEWASQKYLVRFWSNSGTWFVSKKNSLDLSKGRDIILADFTACDDIMELSVVLKSKGLMRQLIGSKSDQQIQHLFAVINKCQEKVKCSIAKNIVQSLKIDDKPVKKVLDSVFLKDGIKEYEALLTACKCQGDMKNPVKTQCP